MSWLYYRFSAKGLKWKDSYRDKKETGHRHRKATALKFLTSKDRWKEGQWWSKRPVGRKEKRREEKRKGRRRVNASCFLMRPIFNQRCLCLSNNHRKLAQLVKHWVWIVLLILAPQVSPAVPTHPMISWEVFPLEGERQKGQRATASILLLTTGYPLCLSVTLAPSVSLFYL